MLRLSNTFDVERVKKLADKKFGETYEGRVSWAQEADVSTPTLLAFLRGSASVKLKSIDKICAPLGLTAVDVILNHRKRA